MFYVFYLYRSKKKSKQKMLLASQLTGMSGSIEFELDTTRLINPNPQPFVQNDISDDEAQSNSSDVPVIPGQQYEEFQVKNDDCDVVHVRLPNSTSFKCHDLFHSL